ncbi:hypothetical protein BD779DRAFT_66083 [Infundibulicybe gibba]|nr:hypothetical protein BD779DRAFT_66083 [Infundibulicybe gibba]
MSPGRRIWVARALALVPSSFYPAASEKTGCCDPSMLPPPSANASPPHSFISPPSTMPWIPSQQGTTRCPTSVLTRHPALAVHTRKRNASAQMPHPHHACPLVPSAGSILFTHPLTQRHRPFPPPSLYALSSLSRPWRTCLTPSALLASFIY